MLDCKEKNLQAKWKEWDCLVLNRMIGAIFFGLYQNILKRGEILVVFDEISWMGGKDPAFLGKLKTAWDMYFSKNPHLIMALVWIDLFLD